MKKVLSSLLMVLALSFSVIAGDTDSPGWCGLPTCPPPPCRENCGNGGSAIPAQLILLAVSVRR